MQARLQDVDARTAQRAAALLGRNYAISGRVAHGDKLGLEVVAEGAETEAAFSWLRDARCDIAQGYFISRPIPASVFDSITATS